MSVTKAVPELLLVEDNRDEELMSLRAIAKSSVPCVVTVRRDGAEALDHLLGAQGGAPALIVLDYDLPKFNGREILQRLRANDRTRFTPVVLFSGSAQETVLADCYRLGANSCVAKPVDANEYVEHLSWIARYWLTVNQPLRGIL